MKRTILITNLFALFIFLSVSCEKESISKDEKSEMNQRKEFIEFKNEHLVFSSTDKFKETIKNLKANSNKPLKEKLLSTLGDKNYEKLMQNKSLSMVSKSATEDDSSLVDDAEFDALLNGNNEIEVEGTVYRITPYGTFIYVPEKGNIVDSLVKSLEAGGKTFNEIAIKEYMYEVEPGIVRYDTFEEAEDNTIEVELDPLDNEPEITYNSITGETEDIETHIVKDRHTIIGGALQDVFGWSASYTRKFSDSRRVKVKFSSPNYILFSYINAKVKYQKKNWIGWSETECEKLILGWDGVSYTIKNPLSLPNNINTTDYVNYNPNWGRYEINPPASNRTYLALYIEGFNFKLTDWWTVSLPP